jgi:branched-chain amino acid transport system ATP-binding protein
MALLAVEGLTKRFDGFFALRRVDLAVEEGELLAVIGPNGAGKTTLLNLLSGEFPPTAGRIIFCEKRIERLPAHRRARLGIARTFQSINLFPTLSVRESLRAALQRGRLGLRHGRWVEERTREVLKLIGLEGKQGLKAGELSHGEQRLLEMGLALSLRPRLLLLDEPTAGLSSAERERLIRLIRKLEGISVILVEHDIGAVLELAERIAVLHQGELLAIGPSQEITRNEQVQQVYLGASDAGA